MDDNRGVLVRWQAGEEPELLQVLFSDRETEPMMAPWLNDVLWVRGHEAARAIARWHENNRSPHAPNCMTVMLASACRHDQARAALDDSLSTNAGPGALVTYEQLPALRDDPNMWDALLWSALDT